jgi:hypothetical protein
VVTVLVDLGAGPVGQTVALVLAQNPEPPPDKGEEFGKASPIGLVVILLLLIATVFLVRSMTKHLRRVPASFDTPTERSSSDAPPPEAPAAEARSSDTTGDGAAPRPMDVDAAPER